MSKRESVRPAHKSPSVIELERLVRQLGQPDQGLLDAASETLHSPGEPVDLSTVPKFVEDAAEVCVAAHTRWRECTTEQRSLLRGCSLDLIGLAADQSLRLDRTFAEFRQSEVDVKDAGENLAALEVAHVFSPVTGRVTAINAALGQRVKKGDSLAVIESPDLDLALANVQKADADMVAAKHNFDRQKELADAHAVSQRDLESAEDDYNKATAELHRSQQMMKILHAEGTSSGAFSLRTPVAGEVISRTVNPGMEVQGQYGGGGSAVELFTVGELDPLWAIADVYEMDLSRVKVGDSVDVTVVAYPDRKFQGRIDWISGALDPVTRTAKVRCTLANPDHLLRPEMYATMSVAGTGQRMLSLPRAAVLHLGDQTLVYEDIGPGPGGLLRFQQVPVDVDEDIPGDYVHVVKGLAENDRVVTSGSLLLTNQ